MKAQACPKVNNIQSTSSGGSTATSIASCICPANSYGVNGSCTACPGGKISNAGTTTSSGCQLYCGQGQKTNGDNCVACDAGRYQSATSHQNTSCTTTNTGYYARADKSGQVRCEAGNRCEDGIKHTCTGATYALAGATSCTACGALLSTTSIHTYCPSVDDREAFNSGNSYRDGDHWTCTTAGNRATSSTNAASSNFSLTARETGSNKYYCHCRAKVRGAWSSWVYNYYDYYSYVSNPYCTRDCAGNCANSVSTWGGGARW
jgi:hypothetical protein